MSLTEKQDIEAKDFRANVEKEMDAHPAIQNMVKEYGAKIKEIKILKKNS